MPVTALPTPPSRNDPTNFATRADSFLGALPTFASELNTVQTDVNAAEASAIAAANTANAAANSAVQASNVTQWVSGTTYTAGQVVWSPANFQTYRRRTSGAGTTDPSADATNWEPLTISSTSGITLNNNVSYKSRLAAGTVVNVLNITAGNVLDVGSSPTEMRFFVNASQRMTINSIGNVGIGTTTPQTNLDIVGGSVYARRFSTNNEPFYSLFIKARGTEGAPSSVNSGDTIGQLLFQAYDGTANRTSAAISVSTGTPANGTVPGSISFGTSPSGTNQNPITRMSITSSGDVGIGTVAPGASLDISRAGTSSLKVSNSAAGSSEVIVSLDAGNNGLSVRDSQIRGLNNGGNLTSISFLTCNANTPVEQLRINHVGNVGFGTSNPTRSIHLNKVDPGVLFEESSQPVDAKKWLINVSSQTYKISTLNDTESASSSAYTITRSGNSVNGHNWFIGGSAVLDIQSTGVVRYGGIEIGYRNIPRVTGGIEAGKCFATAAGFTLNTGAAAGSTYSVYNDSASAITITQGAGLTLRLAGSTSTGNRTIAPRGMATIWFNSTTEAIVSGAGVT